MLVDDVNALLATQPRTAQVLGLVPSRDFATMAGALFGTFCGAGFGGIVEQTYRQDSDLIDQTLCDIDETARRNFEPGERAATFLFARGIHATMGHRVAHALWQTGQTTLAMALKAGFGRAFATDIHPAAQIGEGFWLDHGLGFVAGETAIIGRNVSIWHNVTLGSTFNDSGPNRHPKINDGAIIGAGALILGDITIGAGANIAAGAIVLNDVPSGRVVVGPKARDIGPARVSFQKQDKPT